MDQESILKQLDDAAENFVFPMLDNGYIYHIDQRLHIYCSGSDWLMIIEAIGFNYRAGGIDGMSNCLHIYGGRCGLSPGTANPNFLNPIESSEADVFSDEFEWSVRPDLPLLKVRDESLPVDLSAQHLSDLGIKLVDPPAIDPPALYRSLFPRFRSHFLATEAELAARNPTQLPQILTLDEWHHPDLANEERPSQCETFLLLANVIVSGDPSQYSPTFSPNTHWSNWPDGGTL